MHLFKFITRQRLLWKIILIFWLTTICTIFANIYITREITLSEFRSEHFKTATQSLAKEAVQTFEQEGLRALRKWYRHIYHKDGLRLILLDSNLKKLGGKEVPEEDNFFPKPQDFKHHLLTLADQQIISASGNSYTLRILPSPALRAKFNPDLLHLYRFLTSFLIIFIGSFWLARSIAKPLRVLQEASNKLSNGDFSTRTADAIGNRKDELGQFAKAFDQMSIKIEALMNNQKQLFRDISHEIRTPLTRQKLALELAKSSHDPLVFLDKIERQNEHIENLIHKLLTLMKAEETSITQFEEIKLNQLIDHIVAEAELNLEDKRISLITNIEPDLTISGNNALLTMAFENIILNAIKYSPEGGQINIVGRSSNQLLNVSVLDQGPGIPDQDLEHILKPFYRADQSRNKGTGGFGLGLAIAQKIFMQHSGQLTLTNKVPHGLEVSVEFTKK